MSTSGGSGGRKKVDLFALPRWLQLLIALGTVAIVAGAALLIGRPDSSPVVPVSAIVAAVIAFAFVAWQNRRR